MMTDYCLSKAKAYKIVGLLRTVLYRPRADRMEQDREVIVVLNGMLAQRSRARWGFWKCFDRLRLDGHPLT
jgi:putative transposase